MKARVLEQSGVPVISTKKSIVEVDCIKLSPSYFFTTVRVIRGMDKRTLQGKIQKADIKLLKV
ncbi:MAG: hypothetical protein ACFFD4_35680 [Candidatus Odinarchaeota archaeon]